MEGEPAEATDRERQDDLDLIERLGAELADVEHALRRLDEGTYGACEVCGATIGDTRLREMPAARFCPDHEPVVRAGIGSAPPPA
jgi:RNA polymerase-binding transcription factor DksA